MTRAQHRRQSRLRRNLLVAAPLVAALLGFVGTYVYLSAQSEVFTHHITMAAQNDGRLGANFVREQAIEFLDTDIGRPSGVSEVRIESRVGSLFDIYVVAASQATATEFANELAQRAIDERWANTRLRFDEVIAVQQVVVEESVAAIAEFDAQISALQAQAEPDQAAIDALNRERSAIAQVEIGARRDIEINEANIDSTPAPLMIANSTAEGSDRSNLNRNAALGALGAAMLAVVAISAFRADG